MKSDNRKKIVVGSAVVLCFLLVTGYASFAQPVAYPARTVFNNWNISFTDVSREEVLGTALENSAPSFNGTTATFNVSLSSLGDSITYDFTIKNNGTLNAKVDGVYVLPANKASDAILFTTSGLEVGDVLKAGESTHIKVNALYVGKENMSKEDFKKSVTVVINYVQS